MKKSLDILLPLAVAALVLGGWEWAVAHWQVPVYVLPAPSAIARALADNFTSLMASLLSTLTVTLESFVTATVLGVVTAIAGASRVKARVTGEAGHAGTVPMALRRDALVAAAEMIVAIADHARERPESIVATVGKLTVAGGGAINVIPGDVEFTLDVRSGDDAVRLGAVAALAARCQAIADDRRVELHWAPLFELAAAPCDPRLQAAFATSVAAQGLTPRRLPSGAGHDAMEMARLAPMGMLFVRCGHGGISHNPRETLAAADADVATRALIHFLENFDADAFAR